MKVLIKILKIILGIVIGLVWSLCTIVCLEMMFRGSDIYQNLWISGVIIASWLFISLWFVLRVKTTKKIHTQGIEDLPISISEFIDEIIIAMKYRRSVRAEVRQELTDHFTDALADCDTEEEKQTVTKELIAEFGNIELLGKLLRRAKKRCRPLWRTMVARTFQFIGICFLLLVLYIGWFFTGKPQITTNYLEIMNRQVRPVADDSQNAWPFYKQAAEKRVKYEEKNEDEKFDLHPTTPSPFTRSKEDKQIIRKSIEDNQESLKLVRQGNQKPYCWQVYGTEGHREDNEMVSVLMPALGDYRNLAYLMCWQGLLSAEQGDFEKAFDDVLEVYSFGQHLRGQNTTLIEQLVAMGIEWTSTEILRLLLAEYGEQINKQTLFSAQEKLAAMISNKDFSIDFESEKLFLYDEAQRCFTQSRFGKSHLYLPRLKEYDELGFSNGYDDLLERGLHILFTHPNKEQTLRTMEQIYAELEKKNTLTPATVKSQGLGVEESIQKYIKENIFLDHLLPLLTKFTLYAHRSRVDSEATMAILVIMRYEKEHGKYPESLEVLVEKGLLKEVPMDPFSDKPLVYWKTDGDFILYSVGNNFIDDGGVPGNYKGTNKNRSARRWTDTGDAVFWPVDVQ